MAYHGILSLDDGTIIGSALDIQIHKVPAPHMPTCDGCGGLATSMVDADGNHLCRECGLTIMEDVS